MNCFGQFWSHCTYSKNDDNFRASNPFQARDLSLAVCRVRFKRKRDRWRDLTTNYDFTAVLQLTGNDNRRRRELAWPTAIGFAFQFKAEAFSVRLIIWLEFLLQWKRKFQFQIAGILLPFKFHKTSRERSVPISLNLSRPNELMQFCFLCSYWFFMFWKGIDRIFDD